MNAKENLETILAELEKLGYSSMRLWRNGLIAIRIDTSLQSLDIGRQIDISVSGGQSHKERANAALTQALEIRDKGARMYWDQYFVQLQDKP